MERLTKQHHPRRKEVIDFLQTKFPAWSEYLARAKLARVNRLELGSSAIKVMTLLKAIGGFKKTLHFHPPTLPPHSVISFSFQPPKKKRIGSRTNCGYVGKSSKKTRLVKPRSLKDLSKLLWSLWLTRMVIHGIHQQWHIHSGRESLLKKGVI